MSQNLFRLLVAYDVVDDLRRTRLAKLLESYGDRIQYSVFLIDLTAAQEVRLRKSAIAKIDISVDSIVFCRLGDAAGAAQDRLEFVGKRRPMTDDLGFVL
ncbi:CRISPR-associated endonuclease Cas2 [Gordonia sp. NPDC003376]